VAKKTARAARTVTGPATRKSTGGPSNRANGRGGQRVDALTLLKHDHREVEEMFKRFERAGRGAARRKEQLRDSIIEALSRHAVIEETVFYPAVRQGVRGAESTVLESLEEHHVVKLSLRECEDMDPSDERFTAKMTVMMENVRHHVKEEERELFPKVRRSMSRAQLLAIGDTLQDAKRGAPTRPHPFAPDEPPGNMLVGGAVAVMDRARTTGKKAVRRVRKELPLV
jgi:hemerythrin superfamily protein